MHARERVIVALMAFGGLHRSEIVALDVGDYVSNSGYGGSAAKAARKRPSDLPEVARRILSAYLASERAAAGSTEPMQKIVSVFGVSGNRTRILIPTRRDHRAAFKGRIILARCFEV